MKTQHEQVIQSDDGDVTLKVAGRSEAKGVAGAIIRYMQEGSRVSLLAMGAGAVNQAIKAFCIARGMGAPYGWNLSCIPAFTDEIVDGTRKTAIKIRILKE